MKEIKKENTCKVLTQSKQAIYQSQICWCMPVIPALGRQRQEDLEFKASLGYIVRLCLKKQKQTKKVYKIPILC
jgi:hypothetical protein